MIRASSVMVVGLEGEQLGVMELQDAIDVASEAEMDLVEVAPNADPPVCKIMDFGKYKYRLNKKAHDAKKRQKIVKLKEVKVRPNTDTHDYDFKLNHSKRFLADGSKVKVSVFFRGRQITHSELGLKVLDRFVADLDGLAVVEQEAKREGRNMFIIMAPKVADETKTKQNVEEQEIDIENISEEE